MVTAKPNQFEGAVTMISYTPCDDEADYVGAKESTGKFII